jgi:lipopolysaccharide transport system permease protein
MAPVIVIAPSRGLFRLDLAGLWPYRELLYFLVWRDVKVRYKQTMLGMTWALLTPLFSVFIFTVVFGTLARIPSDGLPYAVFAFAGLVPWNYFSQALGRVAGSLVGNAPLLTKVYFPRLIIPTAAAITPAVDFLFSCLTMLGLMAWYRIAPGWAVVLLPLFTLFATVTALAVGMWLAPINVRFHDVGHIVPFLEQCWMYVSPVVYPLSLVPERWRLLYSLNPLVSVIEGFRWALLGGPPPDPRVMLVGVLVVLALFFAGAVFFKRMERTLADVV